MTYTQFQAAVKAGGWTIWQLRCDTPPTQALLDLMDRCGLNQYEKYVAKLTQAADCAWLKMVG